MRPVAFEPKTCPTCKKHYATIEAWRSLWYVGDFDDEVECLEMRNCSCGSTIAIVIAQEEPAS